MKKIVILLAIFFAGAFIEAQDRVALVVGNSTYSQAPLINPVNDAFDMSKALTTLGFKVILKTNLDLPGFEAALETFSRAIKPSSTALFYYAGHGVQVNGENFLIPVRETITSATLARSRGIPVSQIFDVMKTAEASSGLVFLDACRDNPFPGSSRTGTRGLTVMNAPKDLETLIAYAAEPGETAQDGSGRNGVFTAALLKHIFTEGQSISDMMTLVRSDVRSVTKGKQSPRTDLGLSHPLYLKSGATAPAAASAPEPEVQNAPLSTRIPAPSGLSLVTLSEKYYQAKVEIQDLDVKTSKSIAAEEKILVESWEKKILQVDNWTKGANESADAFRDRKLKAQLALKNEMEKDLSIKKPLITKEKLQEARAKTNTFDQATTEINSYLWTVPASKITLTWGDFNPEHTYVIVTLTSQAQDCPLVFTIAVPINSNIDYQRVLKAKAAGSIQGEITYSVNANDKYCLETLETIVLKDTESPWTFIQPQRDYLVGGWSAASPGRPEIFRVNQVNRSAASPKLQSYLVKYETTLKEFEELSAKENSISQGVSTPNYVPVAFATMAMTGAGIAGGFYIGSQPNPNATPSSSSISKSTAQLLGAGFGAVILGGGTFLLGEMIRSSMQKSDEKNLYISKAKTRALYKEIKAMESLAVLTN